jgi:hypothetical protein
MPEDSLQIIGVADRQLRRVFQDDTAKTSLLFPTPFRTKKVYGPPSAKGLVIKVGRGKTRVKKILLELRLLAIIRRIRLWQVRRWKMNRKEPRGGWQGAARRRRPRDSESLGGFANRPPLQFKLRNRFSCRATSTTFIPDVAHSSAVSLSLLIAREKRVSGWIPQLEPPANTLTSFGGHDCDDGMPRWHRLHWVESGPC